MPRLNVPENVDEFCHKYGIRIISYGESRVRTTQPYSSMKFDDLYLNYEYSVVPEYTLQIKDDALNFLVRAEEYFFTERGDIHDDGHRIHKKRGHFLDWAEQQMYERKLREENPGLQEAYDAYQTLLHLTAEKRLGKNRFAE